MKGLLVCVSLLVLFLVLSITTYIGRQYLGKSSVHDDKNTSEITKEVTKNKKVNIIGYLDVPHRLLQGVSISINNNQWFGSGVLIKDRIVLTPSYVVADQKEVRVIFDIYDSNNGLIGKIERSADVLISDEKEGLALIRVEGKLDLEKETFSRDQNPLKIGEKITLRGNLLKEINIVVGKVSAVRMNLEGREYDEADIASNFGLGGGGAYDKNGDCVGMFSLSTKSRTLYIPVRRIGAWLEQNENLINSN